MSGSLEPNKNYYFVLKMTTAYFLTDSQKCPISMFLQDNEDFYEHVQQ